MQYVMIGVITLAGECQEFGALVSPSKVAHLSSVWYPVENALLPRSLKVLKGKEFSLCGYFVPLKCGPNY